MSATALVARETVVAERVVGLADEYADAILSETGLDPCLRASLSGAFISFLTDVSGLLDE